MREALAALFAFILGTLFGGELIFYAAVEGINRAPIEKIAERAVGDIEQSYENALRSDDVLNSCFHQNAEFKRTLGLPKRKVHQ